MTEINAKILELIGKNASATEIAQAVGMSNRQLFYRLSLLKNKGYNFKQKYYYNGDIVYKLVKGFIEQDDTYTILTSKKDTEFKALLISDLHLGSVKDRPDLLYKIYDYCIKEGIHIIIHAGDLVDGTLGKSEKKFKTPEEQIEYAIKAFPSDNSIIVITIGGNHDFDLIEKFGFDIFNSLRSRRHDIVPIGYGTGIINVKNDRIIVRHPKTETVISADGLRGEFIISGHSHQMSSTLSPNGNINIHLPSLSDLKTSYNEILPGAVKATISFYHGFFNVGVFEHLLVSTERIYKISESQYNMNVGKNTSAIIIKNEHDREPVVMRDEKALTLGSKHISQIDKFNQRYNR